jgi:hypothetical protein
MKPAFPCFILLVLGILPRLAPASAADTIRVLLGSWIGKATGPQGAPPTGDITIAFERDPAAGMTGTLLVKAPGGMQYSGKIYDVTLKNKVFSAKAVFKLGENPLEAHVKGPLRGRTIEGTFFVTAKDQKLGEGTFSITKETPGKTPKK